MNPSIMPRVVVEIGPVALTDTLLTSIALSLVLVAVAAALMRVPRTREWLEITYESLERSILETVQIDARPLVPLILTLWIFLLVANLAGLVPGLASPTRDLSITVALALVSFFSGHVYAFRARGVSYLRHYLEPSPFLLPFNIIGELSRTIALALRLFGNMISGHLVTAIVVLLAGLLVPVPLLLLSVLTTVVQAYIFGVLTLVFAASAMQVATRPSQHPKKEPA